MTDTAEKPDNDGDDAAQRARPRRARARSGFEPINLESIIEAPVRLKEGDTTKAIHPYEATLRQHVTKSILRRSLASIKYLLGQAEKHGLIAKPQPPASSGVFVVPKNLPPEVEKEVWDSIAPIKTDGSMSRLLVILYRHGGIEMVKRCFNGGR